MKLKLNFFFLKKSVYGIRVQLGFGFILNTILKMQCTKLCFCLCVQHNMYNLNYKNFTPISEVSQFNTKKEQRIEKS